MNNGFSFIGQTALNKPVDLDQGISGCLQEWAEIKTFLEGCYRNREQQNTIEEMNKGISLFLQFLYWSNELPVTESSLSAMNLPEMKPVNCEERLGFIMARPGLFHSYRQLSELMIEQEKLYAKKKIVKKRLDQI